MANQNNKKKYLNYVLIGLVAVCVLLLVSQIIINTSSELEANQSKEGYAVVGEFDPSGELIEVTPTPFPTWDPRTPTPTIDITFGE